jgi:hypothetical protein
MLHAKPFRNTTATDQSEDLHRETVVISCWEPSLKVPIAAKACCDHKETVGEAGVTEILCRVALETVRDVVAEARPKYVAEMVTVPLAIPYATPERSMKATA